MAADWHSALQEYSFPSFLKDLTKAVKEAAWAPIRT